MSYNRCIFVANLTRDPKLTYLPSQTAVVDFGIATNRKWTDKDGQSREDTCFLDCKAFAKTAELLSKHFHKGDMIQCEGRLQQDSWEDKQTGQKRSKHVLMIDNFTFVGGKRQDQGKERPADADDNYPDGGSDLPF